MLINKISNPFGKLFYLAHHLKQEGRINDEEKGRLKDLIIREDKMLMDSLNTYNWSKNLQGLENNIVDCVLKKQNELEEIIISPNRSPDGRLSRNNSKKPSRVVVPSNRQLSFYNASNKPAAGIYVSGPAIQSMPVINIEDHTFSRKENHSPSLQVLPTYKSEGGVKELKEKINSASLTVPRNEGLMKKNTIDDRIQDNNNDNHDKIEKKDEKKIVEVKEKNSGIQVTVTDVRGRSKTERMCQNEVKFIKPVLETVQSTSNENSSGIRQIQTATLNVPNPLKTTRPLNHDFDRDQVKSASNTLKPSKANHSVENTPASRIKDSSVISGNNNITGNDNVSRRERSLSAFTDESYEPCGFMDYYKAYKQDNNIPPSEIGTNDNESSAHLKPPVFGLGLSRRNTVEVNHTAIMNSVKSKEIPAISEQFEEVMASPQDKRINRKKIYKENSLELDMKKNFMALIKE